MPVVQIDEAVIFCVLIAACLPTQAQNASKIATGSKNREIGYVTGWGTLYENQSNVICMLRSALKYDEQVVK